MNESNRKILRLMCDTIMDSDMPFTLGVTAQVLYDRHIDQDFTQILNMFYFSLGVIEAREHDNYEITQQ